jgi:hypothetical protein
VQQRFQVTYLVKRVIAAEDSQDAIRHVEAIGAPEVTAIVRED